MATRDEVYKCTVCGNIVAVVTTGKGILHCCGAPMEQMCENGVDAAQEKHVPVIEKNGDCVTVCVGSLAHPMQDEHFIEWIEILADGVSYRQFLKPGDEPKACFTVTASEFIARAYCNLHGLWKS